MNAISTFFFGVKLMYFCIHAVSVFLSQVGTGDRDLVEKYTTSSMELALAVRRTTAAYIAGMETTKESPRSLIILKYSRFVDPALAGMAAYYSIQRLRSQSVM